MHIPATRAQVKLNKANISIIIPLFILSAYANNVCAAPSNGTRFPPKEGVELGYELHLMTERPLDRSYGELSTQNHFYTASYGVLDWLVLDGKIGIGNVLQKGGVHLPKLEHDTGFAGGYGFRIKAFDNKEYGMRLIVGAQHTCVHPRDRSIDNDKFECFLDDWQVSAVFAKRFESLTSYVGIKGSDCEIVYKINKHDRKRRYSKYHVGLISGLELYLWDDRLRAGIEARFFDETALSTSIAYLF